MSIGTLMVAEDVENAKVPRPSILQHSMLGYADHSEGFPRVLFDRSLAVSSMRRLTAVHGPGGGGLALAIHPLFETRGRPLSVSPISAVTRQVVGSVLLSAHNIVRLR